MSAGAAHFIKPAGNPPLLAGAGGKEGKRGEDECKSTAGKAAGSCIPGTRQRNSNAYSATNANKSYPPQRRFIGLTVAIVLLQTMRRPIAKIAILPPMASGEGR